MKESDIERYLHEQVTALGGDTFKWVSPGRAGVPDRIIILPGRVYFAETKFHNDNFSVKQKRVIGKIISLGATVLKLRTFYEIDCFITSYKAREIQLNELEP